MSHICITALAPMHFPMWSQLPWNKQNALLVPRVGLILSFSEWKIMCTYCEENDGIVTGEGKPREARIRKGQQCCFESPWWLWGGAGWVGFRVARCLSLGTPYF